MKHASMIAAFALLAACGGEQETRQTVSAAEAPPETAAPATAEVHEEHEQEGSGAGVPRPIRTTEEGATLFGAELNDALPVTPLATLMADPERFDGQVIKTEGAITQVCQRMGCWMELRPDDGTDAIRVPMAGHSFFLPRDVAGRRAVVQGTVEVQELPEDWQQHLREEGAQAAGSSIGIQAVAVLVHAAG